ncbi:TonB-dependent receptor domain-containing protein [Rugamonas sp. CCM 8940]|uniref:TonB-dependent receptor domain-containing protein n=1 Tax=Rugamonas sp. CCM 8940 TaxID=2765359 RepID=UPI0018F2ECBA|nr:TonB-dependent receptor [Rugamonas sp. CCM 8940]MBJ7312279.1 TonB-dependent receptor [Rugamonas sp. CCM 8940]
MAIASIGFQPVYAADAASSAASGDVEQVVVTATLRAHTIASAPAFMSVVTAEDIAKSPVNSLADLLRETVGVSNSTDGTGRDEIVIRGLAGKYTLMLVNGKRLSSGGALWRGGDFDLNSIPLSSIKRVEIVRGPMAALYGSDAIGGVVNIITKTPTKDWKSTLSGEYRSIASGDKGSEYRLGASTSGAINDQLSLSISGETSDRDAWYATSANDTTRPPRLEEKNTRNLVSTVSYQLSDKQSIDLDLGYNNDHRPRGMYYYSLNPRNQKESRDYRDQEITRYTFGLTHRAEWDWGSTTAYFNREQVTIEDFNSRYAAPQSHTLKEENTYGKMYANFVLGINSISAGIDLRKQVIKDPLTYLQTGKHTVNNQALFLEDEIALNKDLSLTLAGRADHADSFGNHYSPKAYLTYQASSTVTVKGGVSKAFKAPEAYQLSKEYSVISCGGGCYLAGNPTLQPEKSLNYEFGVELHQQHWNLSGAVFKNDVDNMIIATYDGVANTRQWVNVAKAKTSGLEVQGDVDLNKDVSLSANYTRLRADYTDETGKEVKMENRPKNLANITLNWKPMDRLQTSLSAHYTGEQFYLGKTLPAYTRVDLALSGKVNDKLTVRTGVKNLTDVNLEKKSKDFLSYELGRNYYVSATYNF